MVFNALDVFLLFLRAFADLLIGWMGVWSLIINRGFLWGVFCSLFSFKEVFNAFRKEACLEPLDVIFNLFLGDVVYYWGDEIGLTKPLYIPAVAKDRLRSIFNKGIDFPPCVDYEWVCILYTCCFVWLRYDKLRAWYFFQVLMSFRLSVRNEWIAG